MTKRFHLEPSQDAAAFAATAEHQREYVRAIATQLDAGEPLDDTQRLWAAGILRAWADNLPSKPPRKPGQLQQFDHASAAVLAKLGHRTQEELAEELGVSVESLRRAMRKWGPDAEAFLHSLGFDRNQKK